MVDSFLFLFLTLYYLVSYYSALKYIIGSIQSVSSRAVATYHRISRLDHLWIERWRCLRSPSVSSLYPRPRSHISCPDWSISPSQAVILLSLIWPYTTVTSWSSIWHRCTATPPYPVADLAEMRVPVHIDRTTTSLSCSEGYVSKSTPVWYPVNRSGDIGESLGDTWSQYVFFVTRSSARSSGSESQLAESTGDDTIIFSPVFVRDTGSDIDDGSTAGVQLVSSQMNMLRIRSRRI